MRGKSIPVPTIAPPGDVSSPAVDDPLLDTVVAGRYRVLRKIGEGGMSFIYEIQHIKLMRSFALKGLLPMWAHNEEAAQRFEREAELLGTLRHSNVIEIVDWLYLPDGTPCMVLEFLHGATLQTRLQRGPLEFDAIARIGEHTCSALALVSGLSPAEDCLVRRRPTRACVSVALHGRKS